MKGQKEAVVEQVQLLLPTFRLNHDIALVMLSSSQLESIKQNIGVGLYTGLIEYSKSTAVKTEVMAYARSMVMNHLKKARELNGNQVYGKTVAALESQKKNKKIATVDMAGLPDDLKSYVNSIV